MRAPAYPYAFDCGLSLKFHNLDADTHLKSARRTFIASMKPPPSLFRGAFLIQIIYASAATQPFSPETLKVLLTKARTRNSLYSITGMLLYHSSSFLQVLEGPDAVIELVLASIYKDPRHHKPRTLSRESIKAREFEAWSMGFVDTSLALTHPAGHIDYHRTLPGLTESATCARKFLRFFQEGLYRQHLGTAL